jgi:hypothetical protein
MEVRFVEQAARLKELKETLELNYQHKKEANTEKIENEKKNGNTQIQLAEYARKIKNL